MNEDPTHTCKEYDENLVGSKIRAIWVVYGTRGGWEVHVESSKGNLTYTGHGMLETMRCSLCPKPKPKDKDKQIKKVFQLIRRKLRLLWTHLK